MASFKPVVSRSFKYPAGDVRPLFHPNFKGGHPWKWSGAFPPLFAFHQPLEMTFGSTNIYSASMAYRHHTCTNTHGFSSLYGTTVSVANHYTIWSGLLKL
ncbi:hypothetical protein TNCV_730501 [Trichonephila clavipes]|nr:hypothetical protein TNCV_730501 [Trichonephila clavipes]